MGKGALQTSAWLISQSCSDEVRFVLCIDHSQYLLSLYQGHSVILLFACWWLRWEWSFVCLLTNSPALFAGDTYAGNCIWSNLLFVFWLMLRLCLQATLTLAISLRAIFCLVLDQFSSFVCRRHPCWQLRWEWSFVWLATNSPSLFAGHTTKIQSHKKYC